MNPLRTLLATKPTLVGTFVMVNDPAVVDVAARCEIDFLIIDCEHSAINPFGADLAHMLRAAEARGVPALVRTTSHDEGQVLRALDLGAAGVIIPHVQNADQARRMVGAAQFAPHGHRSSCPCSRQAGYGCRAFSELLEADEAPVVLALIEDPVGVANIDDIVSVPGLAGSFFGPSDYSVAAASSDLSVDDARQAVHSASLARDSLTGDLAWDPKSAAEYARAGARLVALSTDVFLLGDIMRTQIAATREAFAASASAEGSNR